MSGINNALRSAFSRCFGCCTCPYSRVPTSSASSIASLVDLTTDTGAYSSSDAFLTLSTLFPPRVAVALEFLDQDLKTQAAIGAILQDRLNSSNQELILWCLVVISHMEKEQQDWTPHNIVTHAISILWQHQDLSGYRVGSTRVPNHRNDPYSDEYRSSSAAEQELFLDKNHS